MVRVVRRWHKNHSQSVLHFVYISDILLRPPISSPGFFPTIPKAERDCHGGVFRSWYAFVVLFQPYRGCIPNPGFTQDESSFQEVYQNFHRGWERKREEEKGERALLVYKHIRF